MTFHLTAVAAACLLSASIATAADLRSSDTRDPSVREAQAARQEARRGRLQENSDAAQRERNRFARCEVLPAEDRDYCIRRISGEGTISGSVEGGGILRELRVPVPTE